MSVTSIASREFNRNVGKAKRAASAGPVFIANRCRVAHALLTIEEYQKIIDKDKNIAELRAMPNAADIDFEPFRINAELFRQAGSRRFWTGESWK